MHAYILLFFPVLWVIIFVPAKSEQAEHLQISQKLLESRQQPTHQAAWREKLDRMKFGCLFPTENCSLGSHGAGVTQGAMKHCTPCHWLYAHSPASTTLDSGGQVPPHFAALKWFHGQYREGGLLGNSIWLPGCEKELTTFATQACAEDNAESIHYFCCHRTKKLGASSMDIRKSKVLVMFQQHVPETVACYSNRTSGTNTYS